MQAYLVIPSIKFLDFKTEVDSATKTFFLKLRNAKNFKTKSTVN